MLQISAALAKLKQNTAIRSIRRCVREPKCKSGMNFYVKGVRRGLEKYRPTCTGLPIALASSSVTSDRRPAGTSALATFVFTTNIGMIAP